MTATCNFPTLQELKQNNKKIFDKINASAGMIDYKYNKVRQGFYIYDFNCEINAWRFDRFLTDAQWKTIAQLCIKFDANISEVIRNFSFETNYIAVQDCDGTVVQYNYPTNVKGWVKNVFFLIEEDGRAHS
jgi:hypothetical protein